MTAIANLGSFYPRRLSQYVPALTYSSEGVGIARINFGPLLAPSGPYYVSGQSVAAAGSLQGSSLLHNATADAPFGRTVLVNLTGAGTGTVTVDGYDYLNQPMSEDFALNGNTAVPGKKAFKILRQITWPTVGAVNLVIGIGDTIGLPYKAIKILCHEINDVNTTSFGTLNTADLNDPATATTGDPKGTWLPGTNGNGTNIYTTTFIFTNDVNANGNGGLHGLPHFAN